MAIAFRLLGRLEVQLEDRASGLGGPKQRLLLALLLLNANEVDEARALARQVAEGLASGELEPHASSIEPLADQLR